MMQDTPQLSLGVSYFFESFNQQESFLKDFSQGEDITKGIEKIVEGEHCKIGWRDDKGVPSMNCKTEGRYLIIEVFGNPSLDWFFIPDWMTKDNKSRFYWNKDKDDATLESMGLSNINWRTNPDAPFFRINVHAIHIKKNRDDLEGIPNFINTDEIKFMLRPRLNYISYSKQFKNEIVNTEYTFPSGITKATTSFTFFSTAEYDNEKENLMQIFVAKIHD